MHALAGHMVLSLAQIRVYYSMPEKIRMDKYTEAVDLVQRRYSGN